MYKPTDDERRDFAKALGARLRKFREAAKLTPAEVGEAALVGKKNYMAYESGNKCPQSFFLGKICEKLGVSIEQALYDEAPKCKPSPGPVTVGQPSVASLPTVDVNRRLSSVERRMVLIEADRNKLYVGVESTVDKLAALETQLAELRNAVENQETVDEHAILTGLKDHIDEMLEKKPKKSKPVGPSAGGQLGYQPYNE